MKLCEVVSRVPRGASSRRWTLRVDDNAEYMSVVRLAECPLYLELRWRLSARDAVRPVGLFCLDLPGLLERGYIRSEPVGVRSPEVRVRIVRGDDGRFYLQTKQSGPRLEMALEVRSDTGPKRGSALAIKGAVAEGSLEHAIILATEAHAGHLDKGGAHYILHPLRVMLRMATNADRIVAVLHDVVEDTPWTLDDLRVEGFSEELVTALDSVTKREGESYEEFVRRAARNPIGRRVKLGDLEDNSDLSRIATPTDKDHARLEKYRRATVVLRDRL